MAGLWQQSKVVYFSSLFPPFEDTRRVFGWFVEKQTGERTPVHAYLFVQPVAKGEKKGREGRGN